MTWNQPGAISIIRWVRYLVHLDGMYYQSGKPGLLAAWLRPVVASEV